MENQGKKSNHKGPNLLKNTNKMQEEIHLKLKVYNNHGNNKTN